MKNVGAATDENTVPIFRHAPLHRSHDPPLAEVPNADFASLEGRDEIQKGLHRLDRGTGAEFRGENSLPHLTIDLVPWQDQGRCLGGKNTGGSGV